MKILRFFFIATIIALIVSPIAMARIIRVPQESATISAGVAAARAGDTVLVAEGRYTGAGNHTISINNRIVLLSESGAGATIIDCERAEQRHALNIASNGVIIDGFTFTGATDYAIKVLGSRQDWIVKHCVFNQNINEEQQQGGVIRVEGGTGRVERNIFTGNRVGNSAGAIFITNSGNPTIHSCFFIGNQTQRLGGAILITQNSQATITNCVFRENSAQVDGGAIAHSVGASSTISFCNFIGNTATGWGGAISKGSNSNPTITNSIFWGNDARFGTQLGAEPNGGEINISFCSVQGGNDDAGGWAGDPIFEFQPVFTQGRNPVWGLNGYFLHPQSPLINAGSGASEEFGMDTMTTQASREPDIDEVDLGYHYRISDFSIVGNIEGQVFDATNNRVLEGVIVLTSFGQSGVTNRQGWYFIDEALEGTFDITASLPGYNDSTMTDVVLQEDETITLNFHLKPPVFNVSSNNLRSEVALEDSNTVPFTIWNSGIGYLEFMATPRLVGAANVEPWEFRSSLPVSQFQHGDSIIQEDRMQGVAFVNNQFYLSGAARREKWIYVLDREGRLVDFFPQNTTSTYGMQDLTWDGNLLWGSGERDVFGFTTEGETITQFEGPYSANSAITFAPDEQLLWISGTTTSIKAFDRDGNFNRELNRQGLRIYGLSYWAEDPDGYFLYIFSNPVGDAQMVTKMNTITGDTMHVRVLEPPFEYPGRPAGSFITNKFDAFSWLYITVSNAGAEDRIDMWQLASNTTWMLVTPNYAHLEPDEEVNMELKLFAQEFPLGVYNGQIRIQHNDVRGIVNIPVTMQVVREVNVEDKSLITLPDKLSLNDAYPNPFNSSTTLKYNLPNNAPVRLAIYDLAGREVAVLVDGMKSSGTHTVSFSVDELPSGVYIAKIKAAGEISMRKLICIK